MEVMIPLTAIGISVLSFIAMEWRSARVIRTTDAMELLKTQLNTVQGEVNDLRVRISECERVRADLQRRISDLTDENIRLMKQILHLD